MSIFNKLVIYKKNYQNKTKNLSTIFEIQLQIIQKGINLFKLTEIQFLYIFYFQLSSLLSQIRSEANLKDTRRREKRFEMGLQQIIR